MRTHVVLPDELVTEIDERVGPRKRSAFIEKAVREQLRTARQREAIELGFGILKDSVPEHWSTPEKTTEWVHNLRMQDLAIEEERRREREERPGAG